MVDSSLPSTREPATVQTAVTKHAIPVPTVNILGVEVHQVDVAMTLDQIGEWIASPTPICRQICTVNPEFIMDAQHDATFATSLRRADLCVPDGIGVLWAARLLGTPLRERVTGSDGIYQICERAASAGWSVYLLGAAPGVADDAARILTARYRGLQVVGAYTGNPTPAEWPTILERLNETQPDILFVAYGHPRQDLWIDAHRQELPVKVAVGIGGALDFVTGVAQRAPLWMQRLGLEWLHRLIRQPWRWRRMIKLPLFALQVLVQKIKEE